ncbi:uncharacterized protein C6orf47 homolog [Amia ocellicauda]|uniref:uncharacterized protein C6orf47 homolog n=1 Tax=Amia ocellicauda TaxID=2972642 RepID=UPI0034638837
MPGVGRVWGWLAPAFSYRPWREKQSAKDSDGEEVEEWEMKKKEEEERSRMELKQGGWNWGWGWGLGGWWWRRKKEVPGWEMDTERERELKEEGEDAMEWRTVEQVEAEEVTKSALERRWWWKVVPSPPGWLRLWPKQEVTKSGSAAGNVEASLGPTLAFTTMPPSPTTSTSTSSSSWALLQSLYQTWEGCAVLPHHYDICFNFLRHLFDLFVVGFLWATSTPVRVVLDVLGVQGAVKLWLHGMALFFVSSAGMAGFLWLIQAYLPQFALVYGILQGLVISVSLRQSVLLGEADAEEGEREQREAPLGEGEGELVAEEGEERESGEREMTKRK